MPRERRWVPGGAATRTGAVALVAAASLAIGGVGGVPAASAAGEAAPSGSAANKPGRAWEAGRYIVVLNEAPAAAYDGRLPGLRATRPAEGRQINARSEAVRAYTGRLRAVQARAAHAVGAEIVRSYAVTLNGFAAELTADQAAELAARKDVLSLTPDVAQHLDTWNTPDFLGLSGRKGAWQRQAGGRQHAGQGTVVGVIDSGIWPEAKSFSGLRLSSTPRGPWRISMVRNNTHMDKADGGVFSGACETGQEWTLRDCNAKLIGARYYPDAYLADVPEAERPATEYLSPRDGDGHGSHTASTAAGRPVSDATVEGVDFGEVSGMAPAARVAAYKVCFDDGNEDTGDCTTSSINAAIEDAVIDGVDVINFSISGALDTVLDSTELAFEGAAEAGVFVATSAGNSGPDASTVAHNSPWLTTVAASTHHNFENTVVLGNGTRIKGASIATTPVPQTPLVAAKDAGVDAADAADAARCFADSLDPAVVTGQMVVCDRGANDRVAKSAEVKRAGGVAMILANVTDGSLDADFHSVPTVHIQDDQTTKVYSYLASAAHPTAAIRLGDTTRGAPTPLPQAAGFSSRGPALANDSNLLKPDIAAPGVSVLAAVAPPSGEGRSFDLYSGTSMASPHIAGLAAFLLGEHPRWSPMSVKSAMMTTAYNLRNATGGRSRDLFAQGAGHVRPARMFDPGLFVTSSPRQWWRFIEDRANKELGDTIGLKPLDAKDLNVPSMADSQVVGSTSFTRRFRANRSGAWRVSVHVPGFSAKAPHTLRLRKGNAKNVSLKLTRTTARLDRWSLGYLTLSGPTGVRLPIAVRPTAVAAPAEVSGSGSAGSVDVPVTAAVGVDLMPTGLAAAESTSGSATSISADESDIVTRCVTVPAGTKAARFDLDAADDTGDLDLWVYKGCSDPGNWYSDYFAVSATGSADESVTLTDPAAGDYLVAVDPYTVGETGEPLDWTLDTYLPGGSADVGTFSVAPDPLRPGTRRYTASWSGLAPGNRYLGVVEYAGSRARTLVSVTVPPAP